MDQDHVLQALRLLATVICCFMLSCWGGCASGKWLDIQEKKITIGSLTDEIAQRLYSVSMSLRLIDHGSNSDAYKSESDARQAVLDAIIGGSTQKAALSEAGVELIPDSTNAAVVAAISIDED
jgi:hypothetical protein